MELEEKRFDDLGQGKKDTPETLSRISMVSTLSEELIKMDNGRISAGAEVVL